MSLLFAITNPRASVYINLFLGRRPFRWWILYSPNDRHVMAVNLSLVARDMNHCLALWMQRELSIGSRFASRVSLIPLVLTLSVMIHRPISHSNKSWRCSKSIIIHASIRNRHEIMSYISNIAMGSTCFPTSNLPRITIISLGRACSDKLCLYHRRSGLQSILIACNSVHMTECRLPHSNYNSLSVDLVYHVVIYWLFDLQTHPVQYKRVAHSEAIHYKPYRIPRNSVILLVI